MKTCLNCEHEPEWSKWTEGEYKRCNGMCKFDSKIPKLPAGWYVTKNSIIRYSDDSGIFKKCHVWKEKEL